MQSLTSTQNKSKYEKYAKGLNDLEIVGALLCVTQIRPDIQYVVGVLVQFGTNSGRPYLEAVKCILHYLKGTAHFKLWLEHSNSSKADRFELIG